MANSRKKNGNQVSRSADALATAYGWGRGWVGLALLATVTSLPELASGVSSVTRLEAPNLAVGNALGAWTGGAVLTAGLGLTAVPVAAAILAGGGLVVTLVLTGTRRSVPLPTT